MFLRVLCTTHLSSDSILSPQKIAAMNTTPPHNSTLASPVNLQLAHAPAHTDVPQPPKGPAWNQTLLHPPSQPPRPGNLSPISHTRQVPAIQSQGRESSPASLFPSLSLSGCRQGHPQPACTITAHVAPRWQHPSSLSCPLPTEESYLLLTCAPPAEPRQEAVTEQRALRVWHTEPS